jgi:hypothetical protein
MPAEALRAADVGASMIQALELVDKLRLLKGLRVPTKVMALVATSVLTWLTRDEAKEDVADEHRPVEETLSVEQSWPASARDRAMTEIWASQPLTAEAPAIPGGEGIWELAGADPPQRDQMVGHAPLREVRRGIGTQGVDTAMAAGGGAGRRPSGSHTAVEQSNHGGGEEVVDVFKQAKEDGAEIPFHLWND